MKRNDFQGAIVLGLALAAMSGWVSAQEPADPTQSAPPAEKPKAEYTLPPEIDDPAFSQYVDIKLLEPAWVKKDANLLVDIALQLAEGQRVLMRPHKAGSAQDLLKLASTIATRKGNKDAIARIEKAAKVHQYQDVAAVASNAAKLASASRSAEPGLAIQVDQANLSDVADYGLLIDGVQSAEILRDAHWLDDVEKRLDQYKNLTNQQKTYLTKIIGEARSSMSDEPSDNTVVATIAKLEGASRHHGHDWGHHHGWDHYGWGHHGGWDHHHGWGHHSHWDHHHGWDHHGWGHGGWGHGGWDHHHH
jgi:hypothetical protein